jgi:hypothetical protein
LFSLKQDLSLPSPLTKFTKQCIMTLVNALILMGVTAAIVSVKKSLCLSQLEVSEVINCMLFLYVNLIYKLLNAISI